MPQIIIDERIFDIDGIIFDKDGTLIDFNTTWAPILKRAVDQLIAPYEDKQTLSNNIYKTLGVDPKTQVARDGPYAIANLDNIYTVIVTVLYQHGLSWTQAQNAVEEIFKPIAQTPPDTSLITTTVDLPSLFSSLQNSNIRVGVATADNRVGTLDTLRHLNCETDSLFIACGDDQHLPKKPDPKLLQNIAHHWNTNVERIAMVGDTVGDVYMAHQAGAVSIGVLSGAGSAEQLQAYSHVVTDSIQSIGVL